MKLMPVVVAGFLWGCGSPGSGTSLPPKHRSVTENLAESERHERAAAAHEERMRGEPSADPTRSIECADDPLEGVTYSGGEAYGPLRPCWTGVASPTEQHRKQAERQRKTAAKYRARAEQLVAAEGRSCAGLGEAEVSRSPLTRADDVVRVDALRESDGLVGARVVLRRVPGLTVAWLRRSLACHQARAAALGYPAKFMSDCPMTLPDVTVEVEEVDDGIEVRIRADNEDTAAAVLGRANDLTSKRRPN